jgi:two-component system, OmpR family, response regulator
MRILIIEDDAKIAKYIVKGLGEAGHAVDHITDGTDGLHMAQGEPYDLLIVDRMLPGIDGLTIVEKVRESDSQTPILFLSALGEVDDRIKGLRAGGDDYLTKPFSFSELLARVDALVRRSTGQPEVSSLEVAGLRMDLLARVVTREDNVINMTTREFLLLEYLMRHAGQVVTRTMLLEGVWNFHFDPETNVIDVHISRLRQKIDKGYKQRLIHTIRGAGYVIRSEK